MLAAAAAAGLLIRSFMDIRRSEPARVQGLVHDILTGAVSAGVSILLKTLWGSAFEPSDRRTYRIGATVDA